MAKPYHSLKAKTPHNTPIVAPKPLSNTNDNRENKPAPRKQWCTEPRAAGNGARGPGISTRPQKEPMDHLGPEVVAPGAGSLPVNPPISRHEHSQLPVNDHDPQRSPLNPLAPVFVPFSLALPPYDSDDEFADDADTPQHAIRVHHLLEDAALWSRFDESDLGGEPPTPCECHQVSRGSCPDVMAYHVDRINRGLAQTGLTPNMDGLREPLKYPSFPVDTWEKALEGYFDADEIVRALRYGWDVSFTREPQPKSAQWNLQGASLYAEHVQKYVDTESKFGSLIGPFVESELPFRVFVSPLNTVDKKNSVTRRTVVDCTQLERGINAFIDAHWHRGKKWKLTLPTSKTIIELIKQTLAKYPSQRVLIFKVDMQRWYRWFLLDPVASVFFAIRWKGKIFLDTALSFGNRAASLAAQRVLWAVLYLYRTKIPPFPGSYNSGIPCSCLDHCECGDNRACGYVDDFLGVSPECLAQLNFNSVLALADHLGLRLSQTPGHIAAPSTECECLGVLYNTENNTMRLPQDKLEALTALLVVWINKKTATEHELAVLCGKLLYAANVISAGRLFLNRCLATKRRASRFREAIYLDEDFWADVRWWQEAIALRNGVSFLVPDDTLHMSLDASTNGFYDGKPGIGAYNHKNHQYISTTVPPELSDLCIADLELLAHVISVRIWGPDWKGAEVTVHTDNMATFFLLTNGRSRDDRRLKMSRAVATCEIVSQCRLISKWIPTSENTLADILSRVGDPAQRRRFQEHCDQLGGIPRQRHVSPEMFRFQ